MWCFGEKRSLAQRKYLQRGALVLGSYFALLASAVLMTHHLHPQGWLLYAVALMPSLPMCALFVIVARYLHEERDEFQRDLVIRCLLWGVAAMLVVELFTGFLHNFGWQGTLPPFTGFYAFCISMLIAKFTYRFQNRVSGDA